MDLVHWEALEGSGGEGGGRGARDGEQKKKKKESACNAGDPGLIAGSERSPGEGNGWLPVSVFSPGESHGQRSLARYSQWGCKEWDMTE